MGSEGTKFAGRKTTSIVGTITRDVAKFMSTTLKATGSKLIRRMESIFTEDHKSSHSVCTGHVKQQIDGDAGMVVLISENSEMFLHDTSLSVAFPNLVVVAIGREIIS